MTNTLLETVRRYADIHVDDTGVARTAVPGLAIFRETKPSQLQYAVSKPLIAIVLQGTKRVTMGSRTFDFGAGESLLVSADVPTVSQITGASLKAPYYSMAIELDLSVIKDLVVEMGAGASAMHQPVRVDATEADVADAALRLMRLLDRPAMLAVLQTSLLRELHFWLLSGRHGSAIRALGAEGYTERVGRAVALIRTKFAEPLRVQQLADAAGMSSSSFHDHFRAVTSLTPLQFQKQLRLIEARRMMLADGATISTASHAVGYESIPQFTREYARLFGRPPARDMKAARGRPASSAPTGLAA